MSKIALISFLSIFAARIQAHDLVAIHQIDPSIKLDIRYASTNNFMRYQFYPSVDAYLQRDAALALARVQAALKPKGFALLVTDAYRPHSVTKLMWRMATPEQRKRGYVADPVRGSRHNRGCAVDVTLVELATGREVLMPSAVDEMSERAHPRYRGANGESTEARDLLIQSMQREGFRVLYNEWWHFDYYRWRDYPLLDLGFDELREKLAS